MDVEAPGLCCEDCCCTGFFVGCTGGGSGGGLVDFSLMTAAAFFFFFLVPAFGTTIFAMSAAESGRNDAAVDGVGGTVCE